GGAAPSTAEPLAEPSPTAESFELTPPSMPIPEPALPFEPHAEVLESPGESSVREHVDQPAATEPTREHRGRRRRGGRGGRNRGRSKSAHAPAGAASEVQDSPEERSTRAHPADAPESPLAISGEGRGRAIPRLPVERIDELSRPVIKARYG